MRERLFTIGHSNHQADFFLELLSSREAQVVVDVRSVPYSRYVSRFNKRELETLCKLSGLKYLFMGDQIGGKPADGAFRDSRGRVDYAALARSDHFRAGLDRLEKGLAAGWRIVLLCAEEDPLRCHRHWLIAKELELVRRVKVWHLRADGSEMRAVDHFGGGPEQLGMF
ncbi:MAG: DUF488 domain-containing protein [Desulfobacteraceae bacterium]|nr:DUF488 domain-containing protein [Desulfobacteraceae bacterium]